jgi:hypothetical protein
MVSSQKKVGKVVTLLANYDRTYKVSGAALLTVPYYFGFLFMAKYLQFVPYMNLTISK